MKRLVIVGLVLSLSFAWAEGAFMGGGLSLYFFLPMASVQVSVDVVESLRLRGNLDSLLVINIFSGDILLTFPTETFTVYAGAGPDMIILLSQPPDSEYPPVFFGLHGTVGAEYRQASLAYFLEVQPGLGFLDASQLYLRTRFGVNFYF